MVQKIPVLIRVRCVKMAAEEGLTIKKNQDTVYMRYCAGCLNQEIASTN